MVRWSGGAAQERYWAQNAENKMSLVRHNQFIVQNMTMKINSISALAVVAALGLPTLAHAQMPSPPPSHEMGRDGMMEHHGMREAMRVKAIHDALNIRLSRRPPTPLWPTP